MFLSLLKYVADSPRKGLLEGLSKRFENFLRRFFEGWTSPAGEAFKDGLTTTFGCGLSLRGKAKNGRIRHVQTHYFPRLLEPRRAGFSR